MTNFKQLKIWQKGFEIALNCIKFVQPFPTQEKFGLCLQITKSGISIPSNIAEGSSRSSSKEYKHFIEISLGSSFELETQILLAEGSNYGDVELKFIAKRD